jgi:hypothetical protein
MLNNIATSFLLLLLLLPATLTGMDRTSRRMYNEHSFPAGDWMGGWKATHIVLQMAGILACLWGSHSMLSNCKWLGSWHRRFHQLAPGALPYDIH